MFLGYCGNRLDQAAFIRQIVRAKLKKFVGTFSTSFGLHTGLRRVFVQKGTGGTGLHTWLRMLNWYLILVPGFPLSTEVCTIVQ